MTDEELVLYFNEHRLAKLESYLLKNGSSVEHELQNLLDRFYEQTVPEHERLGDAAGGTEAVRSGNNYAVQRAE